MVVFTCNHCGESLQKPRVEKHYSFQCRRPKSLTCVDCFKDFKNEEYTVHTKCITEEERYGAKGSIPGGIVKKGEVKQESWTEMIRDIVQNAQNLKPSLRNLFNIISSYTNVPRKKNKFINFLKSSMGGRVNFADIEESWNLIEKYKSEHSKNNNAQNSKTEENGTNHKSDKKSEDNKETPQKQESEIKQNGDTQNNSEVSKKKRKSKLEENGNIDEQPTTKKKKQENNKNLSQEEHPEDIFSYKETILKIIKEKGSISCKKLQKKVLSEYLKQTGNTEYTEKTIKKYNKKLKKLVNIKIEDDVVTLIDNEQ